MKKKQEKDELINDVINDVKRLNGIINQTEPKFKVGDKAHKP